MNGWEYADDARERWERAEMDTDRMEEALAQKDAEIERLRGLLSIARIGLQRVVDCERYPREVCAQALRRSDPDAREESGGAPL